MRNLTIIATALFCLTFVSETMASDGDRIGGLRFGFHSAAIYDNGDMFPGTEPLQSFYVGITRETKIIPLLRLGKGLEYFQNGSKTDDDNKTVLHYLSVPISLKAKVGPIFGLAGFAPSIKVAEKEYLNGNKYTPIDENKAHWFDVPFFVGGGVKIAIITIDVRYHWGLIELDTGLKNQYFQLGAGLSF